MDELETHLKFYHFRVPKRIKELLLRKRSYLVIKGGASFCLKFGCVITHQALVAAGVGAAPPVVGLED